MLVCTIYIHVFTACEIFLDKILRKVNEDSKLLLYGERVKVGKISPTTELQLVCTSSLSQESDEIAILKSYFSNAFSTGIADGSSFQSVIPLDTGDNGRVFVLKYSTSQGNICFCVSLLLRHVRSLAVKCISSCMIDKGFWDLSVGLNMPALWTFIKQTRIALSLRLFADKTVASHQYLPV